MMTLLGILLLSVAFMAVESKDQSCAGVSCLPNPGQCRASYSSGSCCPIWDCMNADGGSFASYGLSRIGGGPGSSFSQSSISSSSSSGPNARFGVNSGANSQLGLPPVLVPRFLSPYEIFAIVRSAFPPGWFNGAL